MFGSNPIISNKYWSQAMVELGYDSKTVMKSLFSINIKEDYDIYYQNISGFEHGTLLGDLFNPFVVQFYILFNYDIVHIPITGASEFGRTMYWKLESPLYKIYNIKVVSLPYGGDFYAYSRILDKSAAFVLNINYPQMAKKEKEIYKHVEYWVKNSDFFLPVFQLDGVGRFDALMFSYSMIDCNKWLKKEKYSMNDGRNGVVKIVHTPNHRGVKGSEFIIEAAARLKNEGYNIELILLEKVPNEKVKLFLQNEADILVEQIIITSYAMSGVEGMAAGLPVISNLTNNQYCEVFNRYSYLKECPIVSACPETIYEKLKILITDPKLRAEIGKKSRKYVEKYHSYTTAQYFFPKVYDRIWFGKEVDFTGMFHPLNPNSYNNSYPNV